MTALQASGNGSQTPAGVPDVKISVRKVFGIDTDMEVPGFDERTEYVPDLDESYHFAPDTTLAILAGFAYNRRVLIQGYHGTAKSHTVQPAEERPNRPCIPNNLHSHTSRLEHTRLAHQIGRAE